MLAPESCRGLIDMLLTYARAFVVTSVNIEQIRGQLIHWHDIGHTGVMPEHEEFAKSVKDALAAVHTLCSEIPSLNKVCGQVTRIERSFEAGTTASLLSQSLHELNSRLMEELAEHYYYPVTTDRAMLYGNPIPFGRDVAQAFPSAEEDIGDCVRCLVLGQPTAAAFHAMRAMEVALKAFARKIGVEFKPSWDAYMKAIQNLIDRPYPEKTKAERARDPLYREILGDFVALKTAWRNPTMHVERRYTDSEAQQVIIAASLFMEKLAKAGFREKKRRLALQTKLATEALVGPTGLIEQQP
ncbi:hypothetical protein [Erythrobacter oryzae]|uniref:hypothetical protein n=1 Tax=Erythrobacter oryzae TaxID=3019556 RepID=UPI002552C213|nr:hypothetical protein [Erythrobacter sp. COR-2]